MCVWKLEGFYRDFKELKCSFFKIKLTGYNRTDRLCCSLKKKSNYPGCQPCLVHFKSPVFCVNGTIVKAALTLEFSWLFFFFSLVKDTKQRVTVKMLYFLLRLKNSPGTVFW